MGRRLPRKSRRRMRPSPDSPGQHCGLDRLVRRVQLYRLHVVRVVGRASGETGGSRGGSGLGSVGPAYPPVALEQRLGQIVQLPMLLVLVRMHASEKLLALQRDQCVNQDSRTDWAAKRASNFLSVEATFAVSKRLRVARYLGKHGAFDVSDRGHRSSVSRTVKKLKRPRRRSVIHRQSSGSGGRPVHFFGAINDAIADGRGKGAVMDWARILAYVTGTVGQELLARNEYLAAENRAVKPRGRAAARCRRVA
jgi:hypothetical protein